MRGMRSKERVLRTFQMRETDRVPVDYAANAGIDRRLKAHFGLSATDGEGLLQALGVDFRGVGAHYIGPCLHAPQDGVRIDPMWGIRTRWVTHETGGYWDYCDFPLREATEAMVEAWPMPDPDNFDYSRIAERCAQAGTQAVYAGHAGLADVINSTGFFFGMEETLVRLAMGDTALQRFTERRQAIMLECTRRTLLAAKGGIDFLHIGEDLGTQLAPMISLDLYRAMIRPWHAQFVHLAQSFHLPVMIHTCGSSSWAYEDFIAMGISVVDTLQPEAAHMSPTYLKQTFGGRLAFHGCISTAGAVSFGTTAQVRAECASTLKIMMPGGGYCFAPTHMLQDNSPVENVLAMYDTARTQGVYRS